MVEQILPDIYKVEIPLPESPLKSVNSYMIKGGLRPLIIDTGWNRDVCRTAIIESARQIGVDLSQSDYFITHIHGDHMGMAGTLAKNGANIYFNQREASDFRVPMEWVTSATNFAASHGFPAVELRQIKDQFLSMQDQSPEYPKFTFIGEGDVLTAGKYSFKCIETPGHSRGHMCLYEPDAKIFISGDHILGDITPHVGTRHNDEMDPLKEYVDSLDKVYNLDVKLTLPGHRNLIPNFRKRIDELKAHHHDRVAEVLGILQHSPLDAYQVASLMTWDLPRRWPEYSILTHWFAFGEALSHLRYLVGTGDAEQIISPHGITEYAILS